MHKRAFWLLPLMLALAVAGCEDDEVSLGQDESPAGGDGDGDGDGDGNGDGDADGNGDGDADGNGDGDGDGDADGNGDGDGDSSESDAGTPDGGDDQPDDACADKQCGDTCSPCPPNDPQCAEAGLIYQCNLDGQCIGATEGMCDGPAACTYQCSIQGCWSEGCAQGQQYCALSEDNQQCGGAGTCQSLGGDNIGCPAVIDPVCGCDGRTYDNDCEAGVAGVNVQHAGACN